MKFFLLVLSSQALLCARVFGQSTSNNDGQQSESNNQVASSHNKFPGKIISLLVAAHPKNITEESPVTKPKVVHKAVVTVDEKSKEKPDDASISIMPWRFSPDFKSDSPFPVIIVDKSKYINLLTGKVMTPNELKSMV